MRKLAIAVALSLAGVHALAAQDWDHPERIARRWTRGEGVQIRIGRDFHLPHDQTITRRVIVIGGSATLDGRVEDDVVVIGGPVRIGPAARVAANVVAAGGDVRIAEGAEVTGEVRDVRVAWPEMRWLLREWWWNLDPGWSAFVSLTATVFRFALTFLAACLVALIAPNWIRRVEWQVNSAPLASGFVGLAGQVLAIPVFVFAVIVLVVTIIGIPLLLLLPFAGLAFLLAWLAGFAGVAAQLGGRLRASPHRTVPRSAAGDVAAGLMLLFALTLIGNLLAFVLWPISSAFAMAGFVVEYLAWTVGLGAALMAPLRRRWPVAPPPLPSTTAAPSSSHGFGPASA